MTERKGTPLLKEAGLTDYEAIAYITLVSNPKLTAAQLSQKSSIPLQRVYDTLESLIEKGFTTVSPSRPKVYEARPPSEAWKDYLDFMRNIYKGEQKRIQAFEIDLIEALEPSYWQFRMRVKGEDLLQPLPSLEAAELKTVSLIDQAQKNIRILTANLGWFPLISKPLQKKVEKGVNCDIIFSATDGAEKSVVRKLRQMGCRLKLSCTPWFPLRETIIDEEWILFIIWASEDKKTFWKPITFRPHFSQHPAIVKAFTDSFTSLWSKSKEVTFQ